MRHSFGLFVVIGAATLTALACGSGGESEFGASSGSSGESSSGSSGLSSSSSGSSGSSGATAADVDVASLRLEPADATLAVTAGQQATQGYKVFGKMKGTSAEVEMTSRAVFYVPDNYLVGGFPADGASTFSTRLPAQSTDPPQRGGKLRVRS